ncbi:hypothetical protein GF326_02010 [Candidatus Bathyarchaeota archaeon]|nr:hypothetical protein [Candidatus Bathyarchaeota archaeon]
MECKSRAVSGNKINRTELLKFTGAARIVREHNMESAPDLFMFVTDTCYNDNAVRIGDLYGVYLVVIDEHRYRFVGIQGRKDFNQLRVSSYS